MNALMEAMQGAASAPEAAPAEPVQRRVARKANGSMAEGLAGLGEQLEEQTKSKSAGAIAEEGFSGQAQELPDLDYYERSFGQSFGGVRVYSDGAAKKACKEMNARAYTVGNRIAFADASLVHDKALVAHELTHVGQQSDGPQCKSGSPDSDGIERSGEDEAERVEAAVAGGGPARSALDGKERGTSKNPARKSDDAKSKWGAALVFDPEGLKGQGSYEIAGAEIDIPIGAGFFLFCKPSFGVKAQVGLGWGNNDLTVALAVEGSIELGVKFGVPKICDAYFSANGSVTGELEYKRQGPWWHLQGGIKFETMFAAGVNILNGWGPSPRVEFGKTEIAKLVGIRFTNLGLEKDQLGWQWAPHIQEYIDSCQKAFSYLAPYKPKMQRNY